MNQGESVWSEEVTAYLLLLPKKMSYADRTKALNDRFGLALTPNAVIGKCDRTRIGAQPRAVPATGCGEDTIVVGPARCSPPAEGTCPHAPGEVQAEKSHLPTIQRKNRPPHLRGYGALPVASIKHDAPREESGADPADAAAMARQAARRYSAIHPDDIARIPHGVSIFDLTHETCRFPIGEVGKPGFVFCGAAVGPEKPYCKAHAVWCFNPSTR